MIPTVTHRDVSRRVTVISCEECGEEVAWISDEAQRRQDPRIHEWSSACHRSRAAHCTETVEILHEEPRPAPTEPREEPTATVVPLPPKSREKPVQRVYVQRQDGAWFEVTGRNARIVQAYMADAARKKRAKRDNLKRVVKARATEAQPMSPAEVAANIARDALKPRPVRQVECLACEEGVCRQHQGGGWSL